MAAIRIGRELLLAGDSLATFPFRGRPGFQPGTRELVTIRPHRLDPAGFVTIIRVWHAAQDR